MWESSFAPTFCSGILQSSTYSEINLGVHRRLKLGLPLEYMQKDLCLILYRDLSENQLEGEIPSKLPKNLTTMWGHFYMKFWTRVKTCPCSLSHMCFLYTVISHPTDFKAAYQTFSVTSLNCSSCKLVFFFFYILLLLCFFQTFLQP